jgi:hypothetical protein
MNISGNNLSFFSHLKRHYIFVLYCIYGLVASLFWLYVGEPWENLADGSHYLLMYEGRIAQSPFGYRILTPTIASLLPYSPSVNFKIVTIGCLSLTSGVLASYSNKFKNGTTFTILVSLFWLCSFPFIYYGTTLVRADAPMFLILALVLSISKMRINILLIFILIAVGSMAHETMLIIIPILWIDKIVSGDLSGGKLFSYQQLFFLSMISLLVVFIFRKLITVTPGGMSYMNGIFSMLEFVVEYSGGWIKHALRIYAAFGPILLFAFFYTAPWKSRNTTFEFLSIFLIALLTTFLATDTLRVMAIIVFPVIIYATKYLKEMWTRGFRVKSFLLVFLQLSYSYVVYGHLRSFESSLQLNLIAALISFVALATCIYSEYKFFKLKTIN